MLLRDMHFIKKRLYLHRYCLHPVKASILFLPCLGKFFSNLWKYSCVHHIPWGMKNHPIKHSPQLQPHQANREGANLDFKAITPAYHHQSPTSQHDFFHPRDPKHKYSVLFSMAHRPQDRNQNHLALAASLA